MFAPSTRKPVTPPVTLFPAPKVADNDFGPPWADAPVLATLMPTVKPLMVFPVKDADPAKFVLGLPLPSVKILPSSDRKMPVPKPALLLVLPDVVSTLVLTLTAVELPNSQMPASPTVPVMSLSATVTAPVALRTMMPTSSVPSVSVM